MKKKFRVVRAEYTEIKKYAILEAETLDEAVKQAEQIHWTLNSEWKVLGGRHSFSGQRIDYSMSCAVPEGGVKTTQHPYSLGPNSPEAAAGKIEFICPYCDLPNYVPMPTGLYSSHTCDSCENLVDFDIPA